MPKVPVCSGRQIIRAFEALGWTVDRRKGSHVSMVKPGSICVLTIPDHATVDRGLLRGQIRKAGVTVERFTHVLKGE